MSMSDALRIMIATSPLAGSDAIACLRAIGVKSPIVQVRFNRVAETALADPDAHFTAADRALIAQCVQIEDQETREVVSLRLTPSERAEIGAAADAAGLSVSEYMRKRLLD